MPPSSGSSSSLHIIGLVLLLHISGTSSGFACLSNPCVHGVCLDDLNSVYFCYCIDGYTGLQCQTNWNDCWSSPCQNGGICIDGIASFNCSCPPGFVGELCEEDYNECESNPCWNNGTCVDGSNGYVCNCLTGYSGVHCEIDIAVCNSTEEARCHNGGICREGPGDTFSCSCQAGWEGFLCDIETDECMSAPCQNGGVCIDKHAFYECACLFGFTGKNCEEVVRMCDKNPCQNGALCLVEDNVPVCYCVPDFHGDLCQLQYDECLLGPKCSNGGTCIDGIDNSTCSCPPNLTGMFCECLIITDGQLDCNYVAPSTTTVTYFTNATASVLTESSTPTTFYTEQTTHPTTEFGTDTVMPTSTTPVGPETTTIPYCVTQTTGGKTTTSTELSTTSIAESSTTMPTITSTKLTTPTTSFTTSLSLTDRTATDTTSETSTVPQESTSVVTTTGAFTGTATTETTIPILETTTMKSFTSTITTMETKQATYSTSPMTTEETTTVFTSSSSAFMTETDSTVTPIPTTEGVTDWSNRTFPEGTPTTTVMPIITTFLTEYPSTVSTSTVFTESETSTVLATQASTAGSTETTTYQSSTDSVDCSLLDQNCLNGGTCIFDGEGHKCLCPFDAEGNRCQTKLGIKNAAFNGNSFLTHRLSNIRNISVELEARTLSAKGLLFYAHLDNTYMALYVDNGYLMFKFSCGYQTMLLSELKNPVNNGVAMNIRANLAFSEDFKHCDALIEVNHTLSMTGDQIASVDKFPNNVAWLHLGGVPNEAFYDNIPAIGFIGCMFDLKIFGRKTYIYKDAEDGFDIAECSSLACLSNPCQNGASCTSRDDNWSCSCRNGFLGKMCELSICDDNPCLFGGTCIPFSNSGYICLCPYGKHGHFCENDLKVTEPYFSSSVRGLSSFVAYPLPSGISQRMEIKFRFTPTMMEQISLLLFIGQSGQHDFYSDHLAVSFVKGYIMLTWNMGSGPRRIFTASPVDGGARDYLVHVGYESRRAWLSVDNLGNITGRSPGNSVQLDISPWLYLGGHESKNFSSLPHDLPLHSGFSGCIFDIEVKVGNVILPLQSASNALGRAVGQCGTTECYERSCQNNGACLHHGSTFMCLCQDKWYGPLCSSKVNLCDANYTKCSDASRCVPLLTDYECDCSFGKVGKYCQNDENITDVSFTGIRSYLATRTIEIDSSKFNVELEIRTLKDTGIIFYMGSKESSFVCLAVHSGLLEFKLHSSKSRANAKDDLTVRSSKLLLKGVWHKVQFGVFGRKVYLYVDHVINMGILDHGFTLSLPRNSVYLGGFSDMAQLPTIISNHIPYTGCLRHLVIDEKKLPLIKDNIMTSRNIIDCDGTPCGGEFCLNGGTCWLDSILTPHCSCSEPYYGDKCELAPKCSEKPCKNGTCVDNSTCVCRVGFEGGFCETSIEVKTPAFLGRSYLIVQKLGDKKRNARRHSNIQKLYLNFTTAKKNGLLLWTRRGNNSFGIGLEKGYIKIIYSSNASRKQLVEVPPYYKVSDGLWHSMDINLATFSLRIDNRVLKLSVNSNEYINESTVPTNGEFYIGGLPIDRNVAEETGGMFLDSFEGCVEAFGTNNEELIRDFTPFEGANINNCQIV